MVTAPLVFLLLVVIFRKSFNSSPPAASCSAPEGHGDAGDISPGDLDRRKPVHSLVPVTMGIYRLYHRFQPGFRKQRRDFFLNTMQPDASTRILDIGGYVYDWEGVAPNCSSITLLNLSHPQLANVPARYTCLVGDARKLDFPDKAFDIVYSNSVIEHIRTYEDQKRFAAELRRVGQRLFIQTPNRWFFVEPHFVVPFVHYLPRPLAKQLLLTLSFRAIFRHGDNMDLKQLAEELRLLSYREMSSLFPDCEIHREKWLGLTKSFIAVRR